MLVFSHSLDKLMEHFAREYRERVVDPFHPPDIIFASPASQQWVVQELTASLRVVAGVQQSYIEAYLWQGLSRDYQFQDQGIPKEVKLLKVDVLQHRVLELLTEPTLKDLGADFLIQYLKEEEGLNETKRIQLAMRLSQLYLEYELNRPPVILPDGAHVKGLVDTWLAGESYFKSKQRESLPQHQVDDLVEEELWQANIYRRLFDRNGLIESRGDVQYMTLPQIWMRRLSQVDASLMNFEQAQSQLKSLFKETPLFLFAISAPAHFHRNLLSDLSRFKEVRPYLLNPCGAFWEDLKSYDKSQAQQGVSSQRAKDLLVISGEDYNQESLEDLDQFEFEYEENRLLQLWAISGRENITLWSQFSDYEFEYLEDQQSSSSQLCALQNSMIHRQELQPMEADSSLCLLKASSQARELETIRDFIMEMFSPDSEHYLEGLQPQDVGIYLPKLDHYVSAIEQVFGGLGPRSSLPYSLLSVNASQSWYSRAIQNFCSLLGSLMTRQNMVQLFRNPLVQNALDVNREDIQQWEKWIVDLNVYRGFSEEELAKSGDASPSPLKTWKLAVDRMIISWIMDSDYQELETWNDLSFSDESTKNKFCDTILRLQELIEKFSNARLAEDFYRLFIDFSQSWIQLDQEHITENSIRSQVLIRTAQFAQERGECTLQEFVAWLESNLEYEIPGRNDSKAGQIVFSNISHAQILPYRVIFVAGLNGGDFPGQLNKSAIDLLQSVRILGDHHSVNNNKLAFLELMMQAKEKLIFSYQSLNPQKDEHLQPSSVLLELMNYFKDREFQLKEYTIPLLSRDERLVGAWAAQAEDRFPWRTWGTRDIAYWQNEVIEQKGEGVEFEPEHPKLVSKAYLRSFLESPLDFHLQRQFGFYDDEVINPLFEQESEFELDRLSQSKITSEMIESVMRLWMDEELDASLIIDSDDFIRSKLETLIHSKIREGLFPEGHFQDRQVLDMQRQLKALLSFALQELGQLTSLDQRVKVMWPNQVELLDQKIKLSWAQPISFQVNEEVWLLVLNTSKVSQYDRHLLSLWFDSLFYACQYEDKQRFKIMHYGIEKTSGAYLGKVEERNYEYHREDGLRIFDDILRTIQQSDYLEHMPYPILSKMNFTELSPDAIQEALDQPSNGYYPKSELIPLIDYHIPEEVQDRVDKRFGDFLAEVEV